jgi:transcriptional regulator with XRE-family HTH domain
MSQAWLGEVCGLSFQQIQNWEAGAARLPAASLWRMAQAMDVEVSYFFEGLQPSETLPICSRGLRDRKSSPGA